MKPASNEIVLEYSEWRPLLPDPKDERLSYPPYHFYEGSWSSPVVKCDPNDFSPDLREARFFEGERPSWFQPNARLLSMPIHPTRVRMGMLLVLSHGIVLVTNVKFTWWFESVFDRGASGLYPWTYIHWEGFGSGLSCFSPRTEKGIAQVLPAVRFRIDTKLENDHAQKWFHQKRIRNK